MPTMRQEQLDEIKETFEYFDSDKNNRIDFKEFTQILEALDSQMSEEEMEVGFDIIDTDNNGSIDFDEFIKWWAEV